MTMTDAYVHVVVQPGAVSQAANEIEDIDEVTAVHLVTGDYDLITQLELEDPNDLPGVVSERIHNVVGVVDTITNVAFKPR